MAQRYPLPITTAMLAPANQNIANPRASAMGDWAGGAGGDDVTQSKATVALATASGAAPYADYTPRLQPDKLAAGNLTAGTTIVEDITRRRGWIAPNQPITAKPAAPTITGLTPATYSLATTPKVPFTMVVTGTGFTPWSLLIWFGNFDRTAKYISPTQMQLVIDPTSVFGPIAVPVTVWDHGVFSAEQTFQFTA